MSQELHCTYSGRLPARPEHGQYRARQDHLLRTNQPASYWDGMGRPGGGIC